MSIPDGALATVFGSMEFIGFYRQQVNALAEDNGVDIDKPLKEQPKKFIRNFCTAPVTGIQILLCEPHRKPVFTGPSF